MALPERSSSTATEDALEITFTASSSSLLDGAGAGIVVVEAVVMEEGAIMAGGVITKTSWKGGVSSFAG